tara:strand:- start:812 stop:1090 length:279 start_codon:yes stop_codon:yes gene_type:complete
MPTTNKELLALIKRHGLTSQQIADLLHTSRSTVEKWRQADGNVSQNTMPKAMLELLEIKLSIEMTKNDVLDISHEEYVKWRKENKGKLSEND